MMTMLDEDEVDLLVVGVDAGVGVETPGVKVLCSCKVRVVIRCVYH